MSVSFLKLHNYDTAVSFFSAQQEKKCFINNLHLRFLFPSSVAEFHSSFSAFQQPLLFVSPLRIELNQIQHYQDDVKTSNWNIFMFSPQTFTQKQFRLLWLNIKRRRWHFPCQPSAAPPMCRPPSKHVHHQVGQKAALTDSGGDRGGSLTLCFFSVKTPLLALKMRHRCRGTHQSSSRHLRWIQTCRARTLGSTEPSRVPPPPPRPPPPFPMERPSCSSIVSLRLSLSHSTSHSTNLCISRTTSHSTNLRTSSRSTLQLWPTC